VKIIEESVRNRKGKVAVTAVLAASTTAFPFVGSAKATWRPQRKVPFLTVLNCQLWLDPNSNDNAAKTSLVYSSTIIGRDNIPYCCFAVADSLQEATRNYSTIEEKRRFAIASPRLHRRGVQPAVET
jgi:hypothetical protein